MKLVLAGAENPVKLDILQNMGATNVLLSYYYMRNQKDRGEAVLRRAREAGMWIIIDSGAFTFKEKYFYLRYDWIEGGTQDGVMRHDLDLKFSRTQQSFDEARKAAGNKTREQLCEELRKYWSEYFRWVQKFSHLFDAFAELDLDMYIGEEMWEWRDQIKAARDSGALVAEPIITPHWYASMDDYRRIGEEYDFHYVGLEGGQTAEWYQSFFASHMPILRKYKIRTHGWATTNNFSVTGIPFYSVDSTTWMMGDQYGTTYIYDGQLRISTHGHEYKERRSLWRDRCEKYGLNFDSFLREDSATVMRFNAANWIEYQKDMESYVTNSYWLTDNEKVEAIEKARSEFGLSTASFDAPVPVRHITELQKSGASRYCNTCFLNAKCPVFQANSPCTVEERVSVSGPADLASVALYLIGMQADRVAFGAFAEKVAGTPLDDKVSKEASRLMDFIEATKRLGEKRERVDISVSTSGAPPSTGGPRVSLLDKLMGISPKPEGE